MKGTLVRTPFSRILRHLARSKQTGSLYLLSDSVKKVVLFEYGLPIFVRSNQVEECLGQILVNDGLISIKQCEQTLETMRRTGKQQGRLLVEMGLISEGNLRYGLETQIREKLFDIFTWDHGRYHFKAEPLDQDLGVQLHLSSASLIVSGILERLTSEHAKEKLESVQDHFPVRVGNEPLDLELQRNERYFLETLDGSKTVREILETPFEPPVTAAPLLLHALIQSGLCQLATTVKVAGARPPAPSDPALTPDEELIPSFSATATRTEFEDTPLPGYLPEADSSRNPAEALIFDDNAKSLIDDTLSDVQADVDLHANFESEILQLGDDELELIDDESFDLDDAITDAEPPAIKKGDPSVSQDLISVDDNDGLSAIDLGLEDLAPEDNLAQLRDPGELEKGQDFFAKGENAIEQRAWKEAIEHLENAYEHGLDLAQLHAMLAYARFRFSGQDPALSEHAMELLEYAEEMDPGLDLTYGYRAAVHFCDGQTTLASQQAKRALDLNPGNAVAKAVADGSFDPATH